MLNNKYITNKGRVNSLTHNQGVVGSCPTGPTLRIKHLQGRLVGVFCFTPGRCQDLGDFGTFALKILVPMFVYF